MNRQRNKLQLGFIDVPNNYFTFNDKSKIIFCDNIIDQLLTYINRELENTPEINRITFLNEVLDCSLQDNVQNEIYEVAQVIYDCKQRLNEA